MGLFSATETLETLAEEAHYCLVCGAQRPFRLRSRQLFRRVLFVKVGQGKPLARFWECSVCWASYREGSLTETADGAPLAVFQQVVLDALVTMACADGEFDERERTMVEEVRECLCIPEHELLARIEGSSVAAGSVAGASADAVDAIASARHLLNEDGRALILAAAFHVACADGRFDARERAFLRQVARVLGIGRGEAQIIFELAETPHALRAKLVAFVHRARDGDPQDEFQVKL